MTNEREREKKQGKKIERERREGKNIEETI